MWTVKSKASCSKLAFSRSCLPWFFLLRVERDLWWQTDRQKPGCSSSGEQSARVEARKQFDFCAPSCVTNLSTPFRLCLRPLHTNNKEHVSLLDTSRPVFTNVGFALTSKHGIGSSWTNKQKRAHWSFPSLLLKEQKPYSQNTCLIKVPYDKVSEPRNTSSVELTSIVSSWWFFLRGESWRTKD